MAISRPRTRLRPGVRTCGRGPGWVQVGAHPDQRLVLPDDEEVRRLLLLLTHGTDRDRLPPPAQPLCDRLDEAGLLVTVDDETVRRRLRDSARVRVEATADVRARVCRLLATAGLPEAATRGHHTVRLVVSIGAEPRRELLDTSMQADRPHLVLTMVAGRVRLGPFVVPGLTACLRCVDQHLTDRDPRHALVVEQHLAPDPDDVVPTGDLQLAFAWAVRDLAALVEGDRPWTWSSTVELRAGGPVTQHWRRHPRCGCAWGDALAG